MTSKDYMPNGETNMKTRDLTLLAITVSFNIIGITNNPTLTIIILLLQTPFLYYLSNKAFMNLIAIQIMITIIQQLNSAPNLLRLGYLIKPFMLTQTPNNIGVDEYLSSFGWTYEIVLLLSFIGATLFIIIATSLIYVILRLVSNKLMTRYKIAERIGYLN